MVFAFWFFPEDSEEAIVQPSSEKRNPDAEVPSNYRLKTNLLFVLKSLGAVCELWTVSIIFIETDLSSASDTTDYRFGLLFPNRRGLRSTVLGLLT